MAKKKNIFISIDGTVTPDPARVGPGTDVSWIHEDGGRKFEIRFVAKHPFPKWKTNSKKGPPVTGSITGIWVGENEFEYEVGVTNPHVVISGPELIVDGGGQPGEARPARKSGRKTARQSDPPRKAREATRKR